ncbi:MAG: extracellular solute-binding protein [Bacteroidales bacterium]|nr:extracellular solute-binding protein [Lachnoclostridium sp.]MCM1384146.1 extracellular solute-binding protein [Lachnoclostridium sp.]MCM1464812.1 extracellular solute-binding protein [Bacteroidales bacterium]
MNHLKKTKLIKLLCILSCIILLTGCGSEFSENDLAFQDLARKSKLSGSTITLMASADWVTDAEMRLGTNFEAATGIQVVYDLYADDVYLDTLFARLDSDNPPDIFMTQSGFAIKNTYRLDQYSVDLSDEPWMAVYDAFSAAETSIDGRNYGMSYFDNTTDYYMIYNKKLLSNAGITEVPTTYDAFLSMCQSVAATGVIPIYEPMADGWHQTMLFAETGQFLDKSEPGTIEKLNGNTITFAELESMKLALEQLQNLALSGYMGKSFATDTYDNAEGYLANGEYAMCMLRPGMIDSIISSEMNKGFHKEDFGIMLLPVCDNRILNVHPTGPSKFISSASQNIDAAKLYLQYIATKDSIQYVIDNANSVNNLPFNLGQVTGHDEVTREFLDRFDDETSGLVLQDEVTYFNEQWGEISEDILKMCEGAMSPEDVLIRIDARRASLAQAAEDPAWKCEKNF